jgi:hypothetical protein
MVVVSNYVSDWLKSIIVSDWLKSIIVSDWLQFLKIYILLWKFKHKWFVSWYRWYIYGLYKDSSFCLDETKNMATMSNSCFWLAETYNIFSKTIDPNDSLHGTKWCTDILYLILFPVVNMFVIDSDSLKLYNMAD